MNSVVFFSYDLHGIPSDDWHSASITQKKSKIGISVKVQKVLLNECMVYISIEALRFFFAFFRRAAHL